MSLCLSVTKSVYFGSQISIDCIWILDLNKSCTITTCLIKISVINHGIVFILPLVASAAASLSVSPVGFDCRCDGVAAQRVHLLRHLVRVDPYAAEVGHQARTTLDFEKIIH